MGWSANMLSHRARGRAFGVRGGRVARPRGRGWGRGRAADGFRLNAFAARAGLAHPAMLAAPPGFDLEGPRFWLAECPAPPWAMGFVPLRADGFAPCDGFPPDAFVAEPDPEEDDGPSHMYYHYTSHANMWQIMEMKTIIPSQHGKTWFGPGVYLTRVPPCQGRKSVGLTIFKHGDGETDPRTECCIGMNLFEHYVSNVSREAGGRSVYVYREGAIPLDTGMFQWSVVDLKAAEDEDKTKRLTLVEKKKLKKSKPGLAKAMKGATWKPKSEPVTSENSAPKSSGDSTKVKAEEDLAGRLKAEGEASESPVGGDVKKEEPASDEDTKPDADSTPPRRDSAGEQNRPATSDAFQARSVKIVPKEEEDVLPQGSRASPDQFQPRSAQNEAEEANGALPDGEKESPHSDSQQNSPKTEVKPQSAAPSQASSSSDQSQKGSGGSGTKRKTPEPFRPRTKRGRFQRGGNYAGHRWSGPYPPQWGNLQGFGHWQPMNNGEGFGSISGFHSEFSNYEQGMRGMREGYGWIGDHRPDFSYHQW